ncbi:DUF1048 domain-containing protein [uncultured Pseudokineococcus sp.]|uniref:DUF1048 domain-containing protein n=1 Tax=uncultured Pseudokineococcus sp. TaxID=1642928 RepID=UPI00263427FB|nr:DUF1048 domain-containing protein [uncultured Pseudokineococcus sp.]
MNTTLTTILGAKKDWRATEARADALPRDYRIVYGAMKSYMWRLTRGDGTDVVACLKEVLDDFEAGASRRAQVLDVTGDDVAAFCYRHLHGFGSPVDRRGSRLNRAVARKLAT